MSETVAGAVGRAHSEFGASSARRLIQCPGSYALGKRARSSSAARSSSSYAAEGTAAHTLAEDHLNHVKPLDSRVGETLSVDGHDIIVDQQMVDDVRVYTDFAEGLIALGYDVVFEKRVSPNFLWAPNKPPIDLFGTADLVAYHPGLQHMVIGDLKFGRGISVEASSEQLLYYGLAAIPVVAEIVAQKTPAWDSTFFVNTLETVVIQPRASHLDGPIRRVVYALGQVMDWGKNTLMPAVEAVLEPNAPLASGDWCKFCPASSYCPVLQETAKDAAKRAFSGVPLDEEGFPLTDQQLAEYLDLIPQIDAFVASIRAEALDRLQGGGAVPGYKLVPTRATREWKHEDAIRQHLTNLGVDLGTFVDTKLLSPAQAEKKLKSLGLDPATIAPFVDKRSSGVTIAPATDNRPAITPRDAKTAFRNAKEEDL